MVTSKGTGSQPGAMPGDISGWHDLQGAPGS